MAFLLILFVTGFLSIISIKYYKKIFNPIFLLVIPMLVACTLCCISPDIEKENLTVSFYWLAIGMLLFSVAFFMSQEIKIHRHSRLEREIEYNYAFANKLATICCIFVTLNLLRSLKEVLAVAGSIQNVFENSTYVRNLYLARSSSIGMQILGWFLTANIYTMLAAFPIVTKKNKWNSLKLFYVVIIQLSISMITMSKDFFVLFVIILVSVYADSIKKMKYEIRFMIKYGKWLIIAFVGLLIIVAYQRNYLAYRYTNYFEAIIGTVSVYLAIPIESFGGIITSKPRIQFKYGMQTFRAVFNIFSYLGIGSRTSIVQEVLGDANSNVYTTFGCMYIDFGYIGVILISIILGFILGALYRQKCGRRLGYMATNAIINMTIFFFFYDFKLSQTIYVIVIVYAILFEKIFKRKLYVGYKTEGNES